MTVLFPMPLLTLLRAAQPKIPTPFEFDLGAPELDDRLSQEGRKAETRCMAGDKAPLSVVAASARAKTRQRGRSAESEGRPSNAASFFSRVPKSAKGAVDGKRTT